VSTQSEDDTIWLKREVAAILERNRQCGYAPWCGQSFDFSSPPQMTYPFQWLWDSCFHAIALSHVNVEQGERGRGATWSAPVDSVSTTTRSPRTATAPLTSDGRRSCSTSIS
jgi:hypothetical protein